MSLSVNFSIDDPQPPSLEIGRRHWAVGGGCNILDCLSKIYYTSRNKYGLCVNCNVHQWWPKGGGGGGLHPPCHSCLVHLSEDIRRNSIIFSERDFATVCKVLKEKKECYDYGNPTEYKYTNR